MIGQRKGDRGIDGIGARAFGFDDPVGTVIHHIGIVAQTTDHHVGAAGAIENVVCAIAHQTVGELVTGPIDGGTAQ